MRLISPAAFFDLFPPEQRVIFVGNAPSLKGEGLGAWIDSFDVVVRFNECPLAGYEQDVGTRTDILVTNPYFEPKAPLNLTPHGAVVMISSQTRREMAPMLDAWLGDTPVLFTYSPDVIHVGNVDHTIGLTTGVYGVHLLSRLLRPAAMGITGFTMFLQGTAHHYWQKLTPKGLSAHDMRTEARIFIRICNKFRCPSVEMTSEIAWVARQVKERVRKDFKIRILKDPVWMKGADARPPIFLRLYRKLRRLMAS